MITLWHNPRCSKSRQALALLEKTGAEIALRLYLKDAPDLTEIEALQTALGLKAIDMMRRGEKAFKETGLSKDSQDADLRAAMLAHPILIERPIAVKGGEAVIGRPPEDVLTLL